MPKKPKFIFDVILSFIFQCSFWLPYLLISFVAKTFGYSLLWMDLPKYFWILYIVGLPVIFVMSCLILDGLKRFNWITFIGFILFNFPCVYLSTLISTPICMIIVSFTYPIIYVICAAIQKKIILKKGVCEK